MYERCVIATAVFHIRWRLARCRIASHPRGRWLRADCARGLEAVERSATDECRNSSWALDGSGNTANRGVMDPYRGNFHSID
jgi:hypothetical protein